jgi:hypothetical protein
VGRVDRVNVANFRTVGRLKSAKKRTSCVIEPIKCPKFINIGNNRLVGPNLAKIDNTGQGQCGKWWWLLMCCGGVVDADVP